jgi:hypothetical protein
MPPDIAAEFATRVCPPDTELSELANLLNDNFLPTPGLSRQRLAVCARRAAVNANVVTVGLWIGRGNVTEAIMRDELATSSLLTADHTCALRLSAASIQALAELSWAETGKRHGRVTLDEQITVRVGDGRIVTTVTGTYDPPFLIFPNVGFTYTITDRIELRAPGSRPPLRTRSDTDVDVGAPGLLAAALIVGLVNPVLGAVVFFAADPVAESQAPTVSSLGSTLALQWPSEILTRIRPSFLPGKFAISWTDVTVDQDGVLTRGTYSPEGRSPNVVIDGPRRVTLREAIGHTTGSYRIDPRDLRPPLTIRWAGAGGGTGPSLRILFSTAGVFPLQVSVTDTDGLSDTASTRVQVSVIPLKPAQQPFLGKAGNSEACDVDRWHLRGQEGLRQPGG